MSCPICGTQIDAATRIQVNDGQGPVPGAFTWCVYCAAALIFERKPATKDLRVRRVRASDLRKLSAGKIEWWKDTDANIRAMVDVRQRRN
jgi:hypothetical protein